MRAQVWLVSFIAACRFNSPLVGDQLGDDGGVVDAPPDISFDGPPECYGSQLGVNVCLQPPTMPLTLMGGTISLDTDRSPLCLPANPTTLCVLAGTVVTIDTHLIVFGSRPLVIVSTSVLAVKGAAVLDVASHHDHRGPGSDATGGVCLIGSDPDANGGGGGRGGSFGSGGGNGGTGNNNGIGGIAGAAINATTFHGGCPGSDGGGGGNRGAKGHGGGAVYLFASSISIDGTIDASGGGGSGAGTGQDGGGGGGSGGLIVFETESLAFGNGANIYSNGGGGGGGSSVAVGGQDGKDPAMPSTAAGGGGGPGIGSNAGTGGVGSVNTTGGQGGGNGAIDMVPAAGLDGAGGGGGGGGVILVFGTDKPSNGHVSPPPM